MSRLERLVNLTATLLHTDRLLTRAEIFERVPGYGGDPASQRRAFERDKQALREVGIPLEVAPVDPADPGSPEGYRIRPSEYYLADPGLEPDELAALHLATVAVRLPGAEGTEALWKLGGLAAGDAAPPARAELAGSEHLVPLFAAVSARRVARFLYRGTPREVHPWRLSFRGGHWYLVGYDTGAGAERNFRLDRIASRVDLGEPGGFERPPGAGDGARPPWLTGAGDPVPTRLLVDASQAAWAEVHLGPEVVVERRADGGAVFAVPVTNLDAFRSFVLGFLDHAEVLDPPEVRDHVVAWLEALCRR